MTVIPIKRTPPTQPSLPPWAIVALAVSFVLMLLGLAQVVQIIAWATDKWVGP